MTTQMWIGLSLLIPLIIFFVYAYVRGGALNANQHNILRLFALLVGGFAGAFITGDALVNITGTYEGNTIAIKGALGAAFAFLIWWTFPKYVDADRFPTTDITLVIPSNATFKSVLDSFTANIGYTFDLQGFTNEQKNVPLRSQQVSGKDVSDLITKLRKLAKNDLPDYTVKVANKNINIKISGI